MSNVKVINNRSELLAYKLAEWVCLREQPVDRLATVMVWCEANEITATNNEMEYMLQHWHDYVTLNEGHWH